MHDKPHGCRQNEISKRKFLRQNEFYLLEVGDDSLISISAFFGLNRKCTIQIRGATHGFGYDWGDKLGNVLDCAIDSMLPCLNRKLLQNASGLSTTCCTLCC